MEKITTIGLDLAKHVFQVHGIDEAEGVVVLAGHFEGTDDAMMVMRADAEDEIGTRLAGDPWGQDMLRTSQICRWTLRIGRNRLEPGSI